MSWQAVSLAILVLVIAAGFAWYERSRPPSRIVALVAALGALAVAGRLVLAPIPNVVATTDIVLFTGYAIGGGPGFVVGALAALVSNFWLGQGPWTPWQMAGWGMVGIGGAALAATTGRHLGRIGLAVACGLAGLAYGALLDLSVMVTYGGEQSLDRYLALSVRGIPFNVAHAAGNFVLALVAGPALVRMLERFRERCEFRWRERVATASLVTVSAVGAALILAAPAGAGDASAAAQAEAAAAGNARSWLQHARNRDGGFGTAMGGLSSSAMTGWAMLGLEAAGRNPLDLDAGGENPVSYLRANAEKVRSTGDIERTILALAGAGVNPREFGGRDLVSALRARREGDGSFQGQVNLTAFGIFALRAAGADGSKLSRSAAWLRRAQNGDGGWGYQPDQPSESDSTGAALQALAAAGGGGDVAADGAHYLSRAQSRDGGWALGESGPTNSQSTAWAIQGLLAAGRDPGSVTKAGHDPFEYLRARQASDGHYRYSASSDQTPVWVTGQVLVAASRETFPLAAVPRAPGSGGASGAGGGGDRGGGVATRNREGGERTAQGAVANQRDGSGGPQSGVKGESASGGPAEAVFPVGQPTSSEDGDFSTDTQLALGALGLLAVLLGAGFFLYRRRLPL
jgi:energy-coupling factor transport system substrate-specific component